MTKAKTDYTSTAAAVWAATGNTPEIVDSADGRSKEFRFPRSPEVLDAMEKFELGGLMVDAKLLYTRRRSLIRLIKGGDPRGE